MFDKELNIELRNGDPIAYKKLFKTLYPRLKVYCSFFISDPDQVNDIIQECIVDLWEKRSKIKPEKSIEGLLFVMVRNRCLNYLKEQKLAGSIVGIEQVQINELQYLYQLDLSEKKEKSLEEQLIESLQQAIENLPSKMRYVLKKCKIEGENQDKIAKELGISRRMVEKYISTAKSRIYQVLIKKFPSFVLLIALWLK